jgi:teichuronic acid biosynthesis glycosyltransferase TuaC
MKLLFLSSAFPRPDDPARAPYNLRLCEALAERHDVRVVSPLPWTRWTMRRLGEPRAFGLRDVRYPLFVYPPGFLRGTHARLMRQCVARALDRSGFTPDAIVSYWTYPDGAAAADLAERWDVPIVMMVGGSDVEVLARRTSHRARITATLNRADMVVATSRSLCGSLRALGVPRRRIALVRRGVDAGTFHPGDRAAARRAIGLADDTRMFLWVGRLDAVKGPDLLLDALARLPPAAWQCQVVGDGPLRKRLANALVRRGLERHVVLAGVLSPPELATRYQAADAVVISSRSEGLPNVLLEAKACGAAVIATGVGGVRELAAESDCVVRPNDPAALAAALARVLCGRPSATATISSLGSWRASAAALTDIIERAAAVRAHIAFRSSSAVVQASVVRGTR